MLLSAPDDVVNNCWTGSGILSGIRNHHGTYPFRLANSRLGSKLESPQRKTESEMPSLHKIGGHFRPVNQYGAITHCDETAFFSDLVVIDQRLICTSPQPESKPNHGSLPCKHLTIGPKPNMKRIILLALRHVLIETKVWALNA